MASGEIDKNLRVELDPKDEKRGVHDLITDGRKRINIANIEDLNERKKELVRKYEDTIRLVASLNFRQAQDGENNCVKWRRTFTGGKQQPVAIIEFTFPEVMTFELVFRPTYDDFKAIIKDYPIVAKYFPQLYLEQEVPYSFYSGRNVLVMDRINGYENVHDAVGFESHISTQANFEQLCHEVFQMVDEIYNQPLVLNDLDPTKGHNIFYNTDSGHYQLFDVDTIKTSDWSHVRKWMEFINPRQAVSDPKKIKYIIQIIRSYRDKYPNSSLSYESDEYEKGEIVLVPEPSESDRGLIYPDNPLYENLYSSIDWKGTRGRTDLPPINTLRYRGKDVFSIRKDLIEAAEINDVERAIKILEECAGQIIEEKFVKTK